MKREVRDALYEAFAYMEEDREGMTRMLSGLDVHSALKELSWSDLEKLEDVGSLWSPVVMKYVLPRWLELVSGADSHAWDVGEDMLRLQLVGARWTKWPLPEVESVRAVFHEWGEVEMRAGRMDEFVCFIGQLEEEVAPYLDPWLRSRPLEVAIWITEQNWIHVPPVLSRWAIQPRVEEKLESAFWANPDSKHAELFSRAVQLLHSVRPLKT